MTWLINVHRDAAKQLEAIPPDRRHRILNDIRELADDPYRGLVKPLKGKSHKGLFRKVSGRYRIIFEPFHGYQARVTQPQAPFERVNAIRRCRGRACPTRRSNG